MSGERILIVDAEAEVAEGLAGLLRYDGYVVDVATSPAEAEARLGKSLYDVAIVDLHVPGAGGMDILGRCRKIDPAIAVLMLAAFGTVDAAAKAFKLGAKDFLAKPARHEDLSAAVARALDGSRLAREARALREQFKTTPSFAAIVGRSRALQEALDLAAKAAASEIPLVLCGETGTGKDLVAAAIHQASSRAARPMVTAVIAAGPDQLQKSALFGHVKGAFTGAVSSQRGYFKEADGSTLFLNEIAEVSLETQVALLRAIEDKRIRPVGADHEISTDVRILCATLKNLQAEVQAQRFREDLYYRIGGMFVEMPALRERVEDIPLLAAHFVQEFVRQGGSIPEIEPDALESLCRYSWPGNVRELKNVMERAVLLSGGGTIRSSHCLTHPFSASAPRSEGYCDLALDEACDCFTRDYLSRLLTRYGGDTQKVADHAKVHVTTIRGKIRKLGIEKGPG
ncbi:MAG: sigma-54 dependent transcriptional regulator [Planctomycetia bacterium]|nr:sigma-54 dependent transcriptional regulator [Planctomycetia bacterium]